MTNGSSRTLATSAITWGPLRELAAHSPAIGEVRQIGLAIGVEIVKPGTTEPDPTTAKEIVNGMRDRGVLIGTTGRHGSVLKIRPPLVFRANEARPGRGHPGRGPGGTRGTLTSSTAGRGAARSGTGWSTSRRGDQNVVTVETRQGASSASIGAERHDALDEAGELGIEGHERVGLELGQGEVLRGVRLGPPQLIREPPRQAPQHRVTEQPHPEPADPLVLGERAPRRSARRVATASWRSDRVWERTSVGAISSWPGATSNDVVPVMWRTAPASSTNLVIGVSVGGRGRRDCRPGRGTGDGIRPPMLAASPVTNWRARTHAAWAGWRIDARRCSWSSSRRAVARPPRHPRQPLPSPRSPPTTAPASVAPSATPEPSAAAEPVRLLAACEGVAIRIDPSTTAELDRPRAQADQGAA